MRPAKRRILLEEYDLQRTGTNRRTGAPPPKATIPATITAPEAAAQKAAQAAAQAAVQAAPQASAATSRGNLPVAASRGNLPVFHLTLDAFDINDLYIEVSTSTVCVIAFLFTSRIGVGTLKLVFVVIMRVNNLVINTCSKIINDNVWMYMFNVCTHLLFVYIHVYMYISPL